MADAQRDLWGDPIEPRGAVRAAVMPIEFEGRRVRVVMRGGEPWWVLADVARVLGYGSAKDAGRMLRDNQKGGHLTPTPGGSQEMTIVSEGGLYRLIMRSRSPAADAFQDWVTDEVLPAIRRTGRYGVTTDRVDREARRIKSDRRTAVARVKVKDANLAIRREARERGWSVNDEVAVHNATYEGLFSGHTAKTLRAALGVGERVSPLDRMSDVCLSATLHAKIVAARRIEERSESGPAAAGTYREVAEGVLGSTLEQLGGDRTVGFREVRRRGTVLDVLDAPATAKGGRRG